MKMENRKLIALLLWLYFFVGQANGLKCYSGKKTAADSNWTINATTQCNGDETCVIYDRFTVDEDKFSTWKGCFLNCTNRCFFPPDKTKSCYVCCTEDLCNIENEQTTTETTTETTTGTTVHPTNAGTGGTHWNFVFLAFVAVYLLWST